MLIRPGDIEYEIDYPYRPWLPGEHGRYRHAQAEVWIRGLQHLVSVCRYREELNPHGTRNTWDLCPMCVSLWTLLGFPDAGVDT